MAFLHMHHAMANKALMTVGAEAKTDGAYWSPCKKRLREIVLSGAVDYRSRWESITVTPEDRETVLSYLNA